MGTSAQPMFAPRSGSAQPMFAPRSGSAEPMFAPRSGRGPMVGVIAGPQNGCFAPSGKSASNTLST